MCTLLSACVVPECRVNYPGREPLYTQPRMICTPANDGLLAKCGTPVLLGWSKPAGRRGSKPLPGSTKDVPSSWHHDVIPSTHGSMA